MDVVLVQMPRMRDEEMLRMMETGVDSMGEREPLLDSQKQSYTVELGEHQFRSAILVLPQQLRHWLGGF